MKRMIAIILAAAVFLAGAAGLAEAHGADSQDVYAKVTIDREAAKAVMGAFGVPEEQTAKIDPVLAVISALGVHVVTSAGGTQVDLDLNGTNVISVAGALSEQKLTVAGTLFPNYLISLSWDALTKMAAQFMPAAAEGTGAGAEGADWVAFASLGEYFTEFSGNLTGAVAPGEPETGEYEFDGFTFDTKTPQNVDVQAMAEAGKTLAEKIMKDEAFRGMMKNVPGFDPEEALKGMEEGMDGEHLPDVTVDVYTNSDGSEPYYAVSEATYKGAENPSFRYAQLNKGEGMGTVGFWAFDAGIIIGAEYTPDGFKADFTMGDLWFGLSVATGGDTLFVCDVYILDTEKPVMNITVTASAAERTLTLEPDGKTVLTLENLMGEKGQEAAAGLMQDFTAAWIQAMMTAMQAEPAVQALYMMSMPQPGGETGKEQPQADPSAWKTLGDVLVLENTEWEASFDEDGKYRMNLAFGGRYWHIVGATTPEIKEVYESLDIMADDYQQQQLDILSPCGIESITDMAGEAIPREELDLWIGKTGQEMLDAGWEVNGYRKEDGVMAVNMINGRFTYLVVFEGIGDTDDFSEEAVSDASVSSIAFGGWSYNY